MDGNINEILAVEYEISFETIIGKFNLFCIYVFSPSNVVYVDV